MIIIIIFQPIAVETLGPINESALAFLDDLGRRISVLSGDDREHLFLLPTPTMSVGVSTIFESVCLSVCPQRNSKTNDPKVFKLGVGNDLGIP